MGCAPEDQYGASIFPKYSCPGSLVPSLADSMLGDAEGQISAGIALVLGDLTLKSMKIHIIF